MKTLIFICSFLPIVCFAQTDTICVQRGHVLSGIVFTTDMYCSPYLIERDTITIKVFPACNYITYTCMRCDSSITEKEKERRIVIWRKPKE